MKIFVTGGTGFVGGHFLKKLPEAGHRAVALRRAGSQPRIALPQEPAWIEGNLDTDWTSELAQCRVFVHFAAAGVESQKAGWDEAFYANLHQSLHLWRQAVAAGVRRLVICSCGWEHGSAADRFPFLSPDTVLEPLTPYAASKAAATMAALALAVETKVELVILRPFEIYGEGQPENYFWPSLRKAALMGEDFAMSPGEQIRDFTPVEKVVSIFIDSLLRNDLRAGKPVIENIGTGNPQPLRVFAEAQWMLMGAKGRLKVGARSYQPDEVMRSVPFLPKERPQWI